MKSLIAAALLACQVSAIDGPGNWLTIVIPACSAGWVTVTVRA